MENGIAVVPLTVCCHAPGMIGEPTATSAVDRQGAGFCVVVRAEVDSENL